MIHKFATLITYTFDPILISLITIFLVIKSTSLGTGEKLGWYLLVLVVGVLPPVALFLYQRMTGRISDWYITKKAERKDVLLAVVISNLILVLVILFLKGPKILFVFSIISVVIDLVTYLTTFFYKISGHAMTVTLFVLVLILIYSPNWWPAIFLILLVGWSRYTLKKHTLGQLILGVFVSVSTTFLFFRLFALL